MKNKNKNTHAGLIGTHELYHWHEHTYMNSIVAFSRFAGAGISLRQESKAHFGLPWVHP